jgi:hypothetical protein
MKNLSWSSKREQPRDKKLKDEPQRNVKEQNWPKDKRRKIGGLSS